MSVLSLRISFWPPVASLSMKTSSLLKLLSKLPAKNKYKYPFSISILAYPASSSEPLAKLFTPSVAFPNPVCTDCAALGFPYSPSTVPSINTTCAIVAEAHIITEAVNEATYANFIFSISKGFFKCSPITAVTSTTTCTLNVLLIS